MTDARKAKVFQRLDAVIFMNTAQKLGLSHAELSRQLGYSENGYDGWIKSGEMPMVAALACEALVRRKGQQDSYTIVTTVEGGRVVESRCVQTPGRMELSGQTYLLVPVKK